MDFDVIWKSALMVFIGFLFLRFVGRKSVSQMTITTTVVLISVGSIVIQPLVDDGILNTIAGAGIFILFLMAVEYITMKSNTMEKLFTGKSKVVINNGQLQLKNLQSLRMTVDKLEMQLRQAGIKQISDVKTATIEPNGQLGYQLVPDSQPLTVGEFKKLMNQLGYTFPTEQPSISTNTNLFDELTMPNSPPNPKELH